jgi:hypothetical protein
MEQFINIRKIADDAPNGWGIDLDQGWCCHDFAFFGDLRITQHIDDTDLAGKIRERMRADSLQRRDSPLGARCASGNEKLKNDFTHYNPRTAQRILPALQLKKDACP